MILLSPIGAACQFCSILLANRHAVPTTGQKLGFLPASIPLWGEENIMKKRLWIGIVLLVVIAGGLAGFKLITNLPFSGKDVDVAAAAKLPASVATAPADNINKEAAAWVRLLYINFKDTDKVPAKITIWKSDEDLSEAHYYNVEVNKESNTAFGPDMGKTPEEVSTNMVERMYRDPSLLATVARDLKLTSFEDSAQAKVVVELENDAEKRRALANEVLGWYANPGLELTIEKHKGAYSSDEMSSDGTTSSVTSSGASNVLVATDEKTGKVKNQRRLDCGLQDFKPVKPKPKKPKCVEIPNNGIYDCGGAKTGSFHGGGVPKGSVSGSGGAPVKVKTTQKGGGRAHV